MTHLNNIYAKPTISAAFGQAQEEIADFFSALPLDDFVGDSSTEWRGSQTLEHLVKFVETIAQGVAMPREAMRKRWGSPEKPSGSFEDIRARYVQALANGAQSPAGYYPPAKVAMEVAAYQRDLLARWQSANERLLHNLESWTEAELDDYYVPHPLLGKLTVRELLFCALCHNQGHLDSEGHRKALAK